jgi:hypothetical protein
MYIFILHVFLGSLLCASDTSVFQFANYYSFGTRLAHIARSSPRPSRIVILFLFVSLRATYYVCCLLGYAPGPYSSLENFLFLEESDDLPSLSFSFLSSMSDGGPPALALASSSMRFLMTSHSCLS